ncbi:MAG: inorganic pyrophosphatase [SAR324 cluster bacterium]|nr:inorganic pyrophosphatase [SAR324 cluster bacterium]
MAFPPSFYRWRPHPWHGLEVGPNPPTLVHAYIEISPFDRVKYEVDKVTGYLRVDRPHRSSSQPPSLYGFIPRTYCGNRVGALMPNAIGGDHDPLDICVVSERPITKSEVILNARIVGGLPMMDSDEADDKIIAILENDNLWSHVHDISELPEILVERLHHYFTTYKMIPGQEHRVFIGPAYGRAHARSVVEAAILDYKDEYGD